MHYIECPVYLWLSKYRPNLLPEDTPDLMRRFATGREVDILSRKLFPGGVEIEGYNREGWKNTKKAMATEAKILFQPTATTDILTCRADILTKSAKGGKWDINEVKSATTVKPEYVYDLGFQKTCFENAGIKIGRASLIHINNKYIRHGDIEIEKLFLSEDITEKVEEKLSETKEEIEKALEILKREKFSGSPPIKDCTNPKTCEYLNYYLESISQKRELPIVEEIIDAAGIKEKLAELKYPLYFLDYETWNSAIPPFDGTRPYQNIPFQYSLLIKESPSSDMVHKEFLMRKFENPVPALLPQLKKDIGPKGSVLAWNSSFEGGCNEEMARMEPASADFLKSINERLFDPMLIFKFKNQLYVKNEFGKSASLKAVLPVLCPELSYDTLVIQGGSDASASWPILTGDTISEKEKALLAENMLKYCKRDTEAMVAILDRVHKDIKINP